jgi:hypothetical protein
MTYTSFLKAVFRVAFLFFLRRWLFALYAAPDYAGT